MEKNRAFSIVFRGAPAGHDQALLLQQKKRRANCALVNLQDILTQLLDYTKTRVLFGRPLAENQAIQIRLADWSRRITTAQLLS